MKKRYAFLLLLYLSGACTNADKPTDSRPVATILAEWAATGRILDAQDGFQNQAFGTPFSQFTDMLPPRPLGLVSEYATKKAEDGWFGQHQVAVRYEFYQNCFYEAKVQTQDDGGALLVEATRLFGPGKAIGEPTQRTIHSQIWWRGRKATATYQEHWEEDRLLSTLFVWSNSLLKQEQAAEWAAASADGVVDSLH